VKHNPFPAIMGRVCYHPCKQACNRGDLDQAVGINSVERFLGDQAIKFDWKIEPGKPSGKKVMIVGAGPAGLSCAYHLRRQGHEVTVFEAAPKAGGMIRYGIPKYRMPREKLNAEISRVQEMGVIIEFNSPVDDILAKKKQGGFDAVFLAVGAQVSKVVGIESDGVIPILSALDVLRNSENDEPTGLNGKVVVYGGGNTAIDVARTAIRLGALDVHIITVENGEKMPAHEMEVREALEEGIQVMNLRSIQRSEGKTLVLEKMVDTEGDWPQASGHFGPGSCFVLFNQVSIFKAAFFPWPMAAVAVRSEGTISPPAKNPSLPVIMLESTCTTPSLITMPSIFANGSVLTFCPSACTKTSAVKFSYCPEA
jgi:NADPH-dependent glutamate synthase beta subunit-like oxidoreductase